MTSNDTKASKVCLRLKNIKKSFGTVKAVNGISLIVKKGEIFSLLGPSGCGKTTLLRLVAGLEDIDEGEIWIEDKLVNNIPPFKRDCSIVFQHLALFPHMTIFDNIAYGLVRRKIPKKEIRDKVFEMLSLMHLVGFENRLPNQLSGGQQQRVALARSLVIKPKILLLDEPLASLDRKLRKEMQIELKRIQREVNTTFLYVTHDQKVALSLSDRIGIVESGKIVQLGTPTEIYETPQTAFVASFMGSTNIFEGELQKIENDIVYFKTNEGLIITATRKPVVADSRKIVGISVLPELIEVVDKEQIDDDKNIFLGYIREIFYQGDFKELTIELKNIGRIITVHVSKKNEEKINLSINKEIAITWRRENSNLLYE